MLMFIFVFVYKLWINKLVLNFGNMFTNTLYPFPLSLWLWYEKCIIYKCYAASYAVHAKCHPSMSYMCVCVCVNTKIFSNFVKHWSFPYSYLLYKMCVHENCLRTISGLKIPFAFLIWGRACKKERTWMMINLKRT